MIKVEVGSEIFIPNVRGRGGHGAYVIVNKINRKSFCGIERERSYTPGTKWRIHVNSTYAICYYHENRRYMEWFSG